MRRRRALLAGWFLFGLIAPRAVPACRRLPQVDAVGGGIAWVIDGERSHLFSTQDGSLVQTLQPGFVVMDVHFDPKRSEFWGSVWGHPPRLWRWSRTRGFQTVSVRAREIFRTFSGEGGRRLIAASLSTAGSPDEVFEAFVALGIWEGDQVRFVRLAPPAAQEDPDRVAILGDDALFGYLIDTARAAPMLPSVDVSRHTLLWFVRAPGTGDWLMAEEGTLRAQRSTDGGRSWVPSGELPAPPPGQQFFIAGLHADVYRRHLYAVVGGAGEEGGSLSVSRDGGRRWSRILDQSSWLAPLFDSEGAWLPAALDIEDRSIRLTLLTAEGTIGRALTLRLPETERLAEEDPYRP